MSRNVKGKQGEDITKRLFEYCGFYVERFKDSGTAGKVVSPCLADFSIGGHGRAFFCEAKESIKPGFFKSGCFKEKKGESSKQVARILDACKKKAPGIFSFVSLPEKTVYLYRWDKVVIWYIQGSGNILSLFQPLSVIPYKQMGNLYAFPDKLRNNPENLKLGSLIPAGVSHLSMPLKKDKYTGLSPKLWEIE